MAIDLSLEPRTSASAFGRRFDALTPKRVIDIGVAVALAAIVAQAITQVIDFTVYDLRIGALNSDVHASIFGVVSLVAEVIMAAAAGFRAVHSENRGRWLVLAVLSAALVAVRAAYPGSAAAFAGPCAVVFVLAWSLTATDSPQTRRLVRGSLYLLTFSFVVHIVGLKIVHELGYGGNSWPYQIKCLLKHSAELSGWFLLGTGILAGMLDRP